MTSLKKSYIVLFTKDHLESFSPCFVFLEFLEHIFSFPAIQTKNLIC